MALSAHAVWVDCPETARAKEINHRAHRIHRKKQKVMENQNMTTDSTLRAAENTDKSKKLNRIIR